MVPSTTYDSIDTICYYYNVKLSIRRYRWLFYEFEKIIFSFPQAKIFEQIDTGKSVRENVWIVEKTTDLRTLNALGQNTRIRVPMVRGQRRILERT